MDYNSDFTELIDAISPALIPIARVNNLGSFTNGYYKGTNDTYFQGFRINGKSFPIVITLIYNFPWHFNGWSGTTWTSNNYSNSEIKGGGFLSFNKIFNFELKIDIDMFNKNSGNPNFVVEPNEFMNIESEKFSLDKTELEKTFKKFTQKDIRIIEKWFDSAIKNMMKKLEVPISLQVARRYDEVNSYSEEVALKYCPQNVKDIFIF